MSPASWPPQRHRHFIITHQRHNLITGVAIQSPALSPYHLKLKLITTIVTSVITLTPASSPYHLKLKFITSIVTSSSASLPRHQAASLYITCIFTLSPASSPRHHVKNVGNVLERGRRRETGIPIPRKKKSASNSVRTKSSKQTRSRMYSTGQYSSRIRPGE